MGRRLKTRALAEVRICCENFSGIKSLLFQVLQFLRKYVVENENCSIKVLMEQTDFDEASDNDEI
ncbi:MAG: hypothetical protein JWR61_4518 [Ferruginibacter sp.]|nr:hypothetical protein [Ferruginibacter sp.]